VASKRDPGLLLTEDVRLLSQLERSNKILLEGMNNQLIVYRECLLEKETRDFEDGCRQS
jgi:hypothetical protein